MIVVVVPLGCVPEALLPDREYPRVASEPPDERVFQCVVDDIPNPCPRSPETYITKRQQAPPPGWYDGIVAPVVRPDDPIVRRRVPPR